MGWTAAQRNATRPERAAELREQAAKAARDRRARKAAARMAVDPTYRPVTKAGNIEQREAIQALIESMEHSVTLRQVHYHATVMGIVKKTPSSPCSQESVESLSVRTGCDFLLERREAHSHVARNGHAIDASIDNVTGHKERRFALC
jgi:hypothetical protein